MALMNGKASVIAHSIRKNKGNIVDAIRRKNMADGGEVGGGEGDSGDAGDAGGGTGGAKTSTTGNRTKTGGSNPGGASTGGAGTVTVSISGSSSTETSSGAGAKKGSGKGSDKGSDKPITLNISNVGGKTDARNHGGMDPGDKEADGKMMANGGLVEDPVDHDEPESMAVAPDYDTEDFLSDEEQDQAINLTYPDPDHKEDTEGMDPKIKKRLMLRGIMRGLYKNK